MKEAYIEKNFANKTLWLIEEVNKVLAEYRRMGYDLTLRQVYYQLVAQDLIPNNIRSYKRLGNAVSDGRKAGLIDWLMIVDRTRGAVIPDHWKSPAEIVRAAAESFRIDKWEDQPNHVEVMVEKDALSGILIPVCRRLDVPFTANKGYSSDSAMYRAGKRIYRKTYLENKTPYILYLGDHDPSGLDMDRDIFERLGMFAEVEFLDVRRLALLFEQVQDLDLPENPAKLSDSRAKGYVKDFGRSSWELDAVRPDMLSELVTEAVEKLRDDDLWNAKVEEENEMRSELEAFANDYE